MGTSESDLARLATSLEAALTQLPEEAKTGYYTYLQESDALLKATISYFETGQRPTLPLGGSIEFGIVPYWIKNPSEIPDYAKFPEIAKKIIKALELPGIIPDPTITSTDYSALKKAIKAGTAVSFDGTLFGQAAYEQLNPDWLQAIVNDVLTKAYGKAGFGDNAPAQITLKGATAEIKIALIGDWGTGEGDAEMVVNSAMALKPDYLIHLGDVYYTGTPDDILEGLYWGMANESKKLVQAWPSAQPFGTSFTLNSNHEMYCGARGYFDDALAAPLFAPQNGKSYFLLETDHWQIFGLDSAYDTPSTLYMTGALNAEQIAFVQAKRDTTKKVMLMTHHNAYDITGETVVPTGSSSLWQNAKTALGGTPPDYWYWGHLHDGVIYNPIVDGSASCRTRCIGHSSVPYGAPWGLTTAGSTPPFTPADYIDTVQFLAGTPTDPSVPAGQVKNGFAMITLSGDTVTEAMYDCDGLQTWPVA